MQEEEAVPAPRVQSTLLVRDPRHRLELHPVAVGRNLWS